MYTITLVNVYINSVNAALMYTITPLMYLITDSRQSDLRVYVCINFCLLITIVNICYIRITSVK